MDIQVIEDESTYAALITKGSIQFLATAQDPNIKMYANGATSRFVPTMDAHRKGLMVWLPLKISSHWMTCREKSCFG